jgi:hypothetical protein
MTEKKNQNQFSDHVYKKLEKILRDENSSLNGLKENLENQYQVLLDQKLSDFLKVLEEQKILVWESREKEKMRRQELEKFLPNFENISLKQMIHDAPVQYKNKLDRLKIEFDQHVEKIKVMKSRNQRLIQKSLEMIQEQITYLRNFERKGYDACGKTEGNNVSIINRQM